MLNIFLAATLFTGCDKNNGNEPEICTTETVGIEDIAFENYPTVDCSTSARAVSVAAACKLLGIDYYWREPIAFEWTMEPVAGAVPDEYSDFFSTRLLFSKTHGAFENLINGVADIIITHRTISPDEQTLADEKGVSLIEKSIALDAFVFVVNKNNPVKSLTVSQIQGIYTGEITNWAEVGGNNAAIKVFTRPRNSGSEEIFRTLVMGDLEPAEFPESDIGSMIQVFNEVIDNEDGICYTFNNYKNMVARNPTDVVPVIAVNGISPTEQNVENRSFPFIAEVHVAIRSDLNHNTFAYKVFEWLQTKNANTVLTDCGFIPLNKIETAERFGVDAGNSPYGGAVE
ncbi:MAG: substrate-binding domain-containing protein [Bacteroidales bacterium]|nr:substrate-binding domain-containing protein [Bacteroidales bacterium]